MDTNGETGSVSLIPPITPVFTDCTEESPGFLPAIDPNKNGLNISDRERKYFGEGRYPLNFAVRKFNQVI